MCAESKSLNMSSVIAPTNLFITINLHGAVKLTIRLTHLGSKPRKENLAPTPSNALTARANTKWTQLIVCSRSTDLTRNGTLKNMLNFKKIKNNQFIHLWMVTKHDF